MTGDIAVASPGAILAAPVGDRLRLGNDLWGFGGVHGGLALALLTSAMRDLVPGAALRSVTGQFVKPIRDGAEVEARLIRRGRLVAVTAATAASVGSVNLTASGVFGSAGCVAWASFAPPPVPAAPTPEECDVFVIPVEFVPFARHTEVRPVGTARPFAGGSIPELTAWIRFVADDYPPDPLRLITLLDALPPSYAAVMSAPAFVPTVELTVRPSAGLERASAPWVLVRTRTRSAGPDGWIDETIDAWGLDGVHLGSAQQLRVVSRAP